MPSPSIVMCDFARQPPAVDEFADTFGDAPSLRLSVPMSTSQPLTLG
jgi:hypothetical protein